MSDPRVLFVDDDPETLESLNTWFSRRGFHVVPADHPRQAIAYAAQHDFDAAVLDANLPETNGLDLMERLHGYSDVPIIMLSGNDDIAFHNEAVERGAYRFLLKPFSMRNLEVVIRAALVDGCGAARSKIAIRRVSEDEPASSL